MRLHTAVVSFLTWERYVRGISPLSQRLYACHLGAFERFAGRRASIGAALKRLDDFLIALGERGAGCHHRAKAYAVIGLLAKYLKRRGQLKSDPLLDVPRPLIRRAEPVFLRYEVTRRLMRRLACRGGMHAERDAVLAATLYYCFLRVSEARRLRPSDVDLESLILRVVGKGAKVLPVPIPKALAPILSAWLHTRPTKAEYLFPSRALNATRYGQLDNSRVELVVRQLGEPGVTPHTFRRSAAQDLADKREPTRRIQLLLRHAHESTTQLYLRRDVEALRESANKLDGEGHSNGQ